MIHCVKSAAACVACLGSFFWAATGTAQAAEYYVAPTGSDTNPGTMALPFKTVGRGQTAAAAGDTVFIRGGLYTFSGTSAAVGVAFTKNGQPDRRIQYFAFPGELPIFDLFGLVPQARVTGFDVNCDWIHIRGVEVRGVQQVITGDSWGVRIRGDNNILEHLDVHHNESPGLFITSGANNLILNCDSHHNYDPLEGGGNGDGFGCHSPGGGNVLSGCRAFNNSDDGFDFISAAGSCMAEKSWSFSNGWVPGTMTAAGNGAGFKSGGYGTDTSTFPPVIPRHTIRMNVAFGNRSQGFYANHHPGGIDFFNNTAFRNTTNFDMLADVGASSHKLRNNIAMAPGTAIARLTGGTATFNSWTLPVTVTAADFLGTAEADALAPREDDGSLPTVDFMHLNTASDLVDKGEDVGLPFAGSAPDLGAFECGLVTGTGGASGATGGRAGSGGVSGSGGSVTPGSGGGVTPGSGGSGGAGGAGGRIAATGGSSGSGGTSGSGGGLLGSGGSGTGGGISSGGAGARDAGALGSGGSTGQPNRNNGGGVEGSVGCGCGISRAPNQAGGAGGPLFVAALAVWVFSRRRRQARPPRDR